MWLPGRSVTQALDDAGSAAAHTLMFPDMVLIDGSSNAAMFSVSGGVMLQLTARARSSRAKKKRVAEVEI